MRWTRCAPVLVENPEQARRRARLQRSLEEKLARPALVPIRLPHHLGEADLASSFATRHDPPPCFELLQRRFRGELRVSTRTCVADLRSSLLVRDQDLEDVVRLDPDVRTSSSKKVINETTVLIYPNTPQKARAKYQELVVKSFYIAKRRR